MIALVEKFFLGTFLGSVFWFVLVSLVMLVMASRGSKKGKIVATAIVLLCVWLLILLLAYFNLDKVQGWMQW